MKLRGQKCVFQDGNHEIIVENAWSWSMFSQERIQINGEIVFARSGALDVAWKWTEAHKEAWLTQLGDETLSVQYISGFMKVHARVYIGDRKLEHVDYFEGKWTAESEPWPD